MKKIIINKEISPFDEDYFLVKFNYNSPRKLDRRNK
jgi:hypothetical protein